MVELFPPIEPYDRGLLDVGDGNAIFFEVSGNPKGKPALVLHGGPGQGCSPNMRRAFDPSVYRIILFDQRGCGRSTPHASVPETNMAFNTTPHLVRDMEKLRTHLGVDHWLLSGASWGATLALAYAVEHHAHVAAIVLLSITTSRRVETEWLYGGAARFFPEAFERFREHVPESRDIGILEAYARRMEDPERRLAAAHAWSAWEDAVLSMESQESGWLGVLDEDLIALVRICTHYARHHAWLEEGQLLHYAAKLANVPGVLIHGRRDMSCPIETAVALHRAWPGSELIVLEDSGHLRSDSKRRALLEAHTRFGR